jgi:hypothetical protein
MRAFLFQASVNPTSAKQYDLRVSPAVGSKIWWPADVYRSYMQPGMLVFFWLAGTVEVRGLHGWGRLASEPYKEGKDHRVDVTFAGRFEPHVPASDIQLDPALSKHAIFTVRAGSVFLLESDEVDALIQHIPLAQRQTLSTAPTLPAL